MPPVDRPRFEPEPFQPPWYLRNGHIQTLLGAVRRMPEGVSTRRERLELPDGDFLDVDWLDRDASAPLIVICHGLESCSQAPYVREVMAAASQAGMQALAINFRGCSGEPNRLAISYNAGDTRDIHFVLMTLRDRFPGRQIGLVGFSLGGNVICKWLGEQERHARSLVQAAAVACVPFDLKACQETMDTRFLRLYSRRFMRTLIARAREKARRFPGAFDWERARNATTFEVFDDAVTAQLYGYQDYRDYYQKNSSLPWLTEIRIPTLLLIANDDPLIPPSAMPQPGDVSESVQIQASAHGGHCGFIGDRQHPDWMARQLVRWVHHHLAS